MPDNPNPNVRVIQALLGVQTAAKAYAILSSAGISEAAEEALEFLSHGVHDAQGSESRLLARAALALIATNLLSNNVA